MGRKSSKKKFSSIRQPMARRKDAKLSNEIRDKIEKDGGDEDGQVTFAFTRFAIVDDMIRMYCDHMSHMIELLQQHGKLIVGSVIFFAPIDAATATTAALNLGSGNYSARSHYLPEINSQQRFLFGVRTRDDNRAEQSPHIPLCVDYIFSNSQRDLRNDRKRLRTFFEPFLCEFWQNSIDRSPVVSVYAREFVKHDRRQWFMLIWRKSATRCEHGVIDEVLAEFFQFSKFMLSKFRAFDFEILAAQISDIFFHHVSANHDYEIMMTPVDDRAAISAPSESVNIFRKCSQDIDMFIKFIDELFSEKFAVDTLISLSSLPLVASSSEPVTNLPKLSSHNVRNKEEVIKVVKDAAAAIGLAVEKIKSSIVTGKVNNTDQILDKMYEQIEAIRRDIDDLISSEKKVAGADDTTDGAADRNDGNDDTNNNNNDEDDDEKEEKDVSIEIDTTTYVKGKIPSSDSMKSFNTAKSNSSEPHSLNAIEINPNQANDDDNNGSVAESIEVESLTYFKDIISNEDSIKSLFDAQCKDFDSRSSSATEIDPDWADDYDLDNIFDYCDDLACADLDDDADDAAENRIRIERNEQVQQVENDNVHAKIKQPMMMMKKSKKHNQELIRDRDTTTNDRPSFDDIKCKSNNSNHSSNKNTDDKRRNLSPPEPPVRPSCVAERILAGLEDEIRERLIAMMHMMLPKFVPTWMTRIPAHPGVAIGCIDVRQSVRQRAEADLAAIAVSAQIVKLQQEYRSDYQQATRHRDSLRDHLSMKRHRWRLALKGEYGSLDAMLISAIVGGKNGTKKRIRESEIYHLL